MRLKSWIPEWKPRNSRSWNSKSNYFCIYRLPQISFETEIKRNLRMMKQEMCVFFNQLPFSFFLSQKSTANRCLFTLSLGIEYLICTTNALLKCTFTLHIIFILFSFFRVTYKGIFRLTTDRSFFSIEK